jgi:hypothetical protein
LAVSGPLLVASCASSSTHDASADQAETSSSPALYGVYATSDPGPIARLNFYDKSHYVMTKSGCSGDCTVPGSYVVTGNTLVLHPDGGGDAMRLTLSEVSMGLLPQTDQADIVSNAPKHLVTPTNCLIVKKMTFDSQNLNQQYATARDFAETMIDQAKGAVEVPDRDSLSWLKDKETAMADTCRGRSGAPPGASAASYGTIDFVLTRSCFAGNPGSSANIKVYTRAGDEVTTLTWDSYRGNYTWDDTAQINRVLAQAETACKAYQQ